MLNNKWMYFLLALIVMPVFAAAPDKNNLETQFEKIMGKRPVISTINPTPIANIYEIVIGSDVFHVTADGNYILYGHLIDVSGTTPNSLTEDKGKQLRVQFIKTVDEQTMLTFKPKGEVRHTITVFTDLDCTYCRQLHKEIPQLNQHGIAVRYIAFPRTGINSPSFEKLVAVWCADNPQQAFTDATNGRNIPLKGDCSQADILKEHLELVDKIGLRVTPVLVLENGEMISGYVPADQLISKLSNLPKG